MSEVRNYSEPVRREKSLKKSTRLENLVLQKTPEEYMWLAINWL